MTSLLQWCNRWQLPPQAVQELMQVMGTGLPAVESVPTKATSEAATQAHRMLRAAKLGRILWRNNSGACTDQTGRVIRYGLGNISQQVNRVMKSSDLIGITPVVITPQHVGQTVGIFTAEEVKAASWKFRQTDERAVAQFNFLKKVASLGGIAHFVTDKEQQP